MTRPTSGKISARPAVPYGRILPGLVLVGTVAALYRLAYALSVHEAALFVQPVIDAEQHHAWAMRIAAGNVLGHGPDDVFKPPLYPMLVGLWYSLFGAKILAIQIMQFGLGVTSAVLTALLGRRLFGPFVGLVAGLLAALYAPSLFFEGQLLTPAMSMLLNLLFVLALLGALRRGVFAWLVLGLLAGLAGAMRPDALLALGLATAGALVSIVRSLGVRRAAGLAGAFALGAVLVLGAVTIRNHTLTGEIVPVSANAGINFYTGNGPDADGVSAIPTGLAWEEAVTSVPADVLPHPAATSRLWFSRGLENIVRSPGRALALLGLKAIAFWNGREFRNNIGYDDFREDRPLLRFPFVQFWPVSALALLGVGLCLHRRHESEGTTLPLLVVLGYFAAGLVFFVTARYRMPATPFLILLAARTIAWLREHSRASWWPGPAPTALVLVALALTWPGWFPLSARGESLDEINLGNVQRSRGRPDRALAHYQRARTLDPENADGALLVGILLLQHGKHAEAVAPLEDAARLSPATVDPHLNLAQARLALGREDEALASYDRILEIRETRNLEPKSASVAKALLGRSGILARRGRLAEARRDSEEAWRTSDRTAAEYALLTRTDLVRAKEVFARVAEEEPWSWYQRANLGMAHLALEEFAAAAREFERAAALVGAKPGVRYHLGIALRRAGRGEDAARVLRALLAELPPRSGLAENVRQELGRIR